MKPERIGYFGGTFDPPHRGHLAVARAARDHFQLDRVLLAPTGRQPLKPSGPEASWPDRYRMTELLCDGETGLEASEIDQPRSDGQPNYTADTLRRLETLLTQNWHGPFPPPPHKIYGILGADAFLTMPSWREPEALLNLADWIVVSRPGYEAISDRIRSFREVGRVYGLLNLDVPISSTEVRVRLKAGLECAQLLPEAVLTYIEQRRVY